MFITKKHLSRRTVLKGAGVSVALPLLDAMIPAGTALAQTAAVPKLRTAFFYLPHGAIMGNTSHGPSADKWTSSGAGADFKLSPILSPLEPYKKYVNSFGNLENAASAGSVHTLNPATWLSATRPDTGGPRAHMATTLDQVIAKGIGQETPLPSDLSGAGADFKLSPILSPLEPYKKYVNSFGNLENAASAGSVHTLNPATWLSATRPDTGGPRAHMATTLDQVIAKGIGQETPLP